MNKLTNNEKYFQYQLKFGERGEREVNKILIKEGYYTLPLFQFRRRETEINGVPSFKFLDENKIKRELVSPDIIAIKEKVILVECKRKKQWVRGYGSVSNGYDESLETGLEYFRLREYLKLIENNNVELHLYFIQEGKSPIGIYRIIFNNDNKSDLLSLSRSVYLMTEKREYMIFFNIDNLEKIK